MLTRIASTIAALGLAAGAFFGESPSPGGVDNLFGILFLFVAIILWFDWETVRDGFRDCGHPMMLVRLAPILEQMPQRRAPRRRPGERAKSG